MCENQNKLDGDSWLCVVQFLRPKHVPFLQLVCKEWYSEYQRSSYNFLTFPAVFSSDALWKPLFHQFFRTWDETAYASIQCNFLQCVNTKSLLTNPKGIPESCFFFPTPQQERVKVQSLCVVCLICVFLPPPDKFSDLASMKEESKFRTYKLAAMLAALHSSGYTPSWYDTIAIGITRMIFCS